MLGQILNQGFVELVEQAHLVRVNELGTTEKGDTFIRCTGLSPDGNGGLAAKLVVNVFPGAAMLSKLKEVIKADGLLLVFGELSVADTDYGNVTRSIASARLAHFNSEGLFELDGGIMEGQPGSMVVVPIQSKATLKTLETVEDRAPGRRVVELKARHGRRTMGKAAPDADTQAEPDAAGATSTV
jgi:hypothetical protein